MRFLQRLFRVEVRRQKAAPMLDHSVLGALRWLPESWWVGERRLGDGSCLEFCVAGTTEGPTANLVPELSRTLAHWSETWASILVFLRHELNDAPDVQSSFSPACLNYLWNNKPGQFWVELKFKGDMDSVWRVEFVDEQPKCVTRDD